MRQDREKEARSDNGSTKSTPNIAHIPTWPYPLPAREKRSTHTMKKEGAEKGNWTNERTRQGHGMRTRAPHTPSGAVGPPVHTSCCYNDGITNHTTPSPLVLAQSHRPVSNPTLKSTSSSPSSSPRPSLLSASPSPPPSLPTSTFGGSRQPTSCTRRTSRRRRTNVPLPGGERPSVI